MTASVELHLEVPSLEELRAAQARIAGAAVRTPLIRLDWPDGPVGTELLLKLELLQPVRSFKLRGAYNAMAAAGAEALREGVWTASAGNMAQAVAWSARVLGVPCTVYVPETAPRAKVNNVKGYGGQVIELPVMEWVDIFRTRSRADARGVFIHPYSDPLVIAGNGVVGLEIAEDVPDVDTVIAPYGGGGLSTGIAAALSHLAPSARVFASEIDTGAPLGPSLAAGSPVEVPYAPSFADGIGAPFVNAEMFELAQRLGMGAIVVSREQTAEAARLLIRRAGIVPEGAAATTLAAALTGAAGSGRIVCVISGANVDPAVLITILSGGTPA
jgi:threonine dehydratase